LHNPIDVEPAVKATGRDLVDLVMGKDPSLGIVPFGVITDGPNTWGGPNGKLTTIRGTQMPQGSWDEWLADFRAWLIACRLDPTARWEKGFSDVSGSLYVGTGKPLAQYMIENEIKVIEGHSLGGPVATNIGAEAGVDLAVIIESPNPGDAAFKKYVNSRIPTIRSYWNPRDKIGRVPLDAHIFPPFLVEDFVPVTDSKILLDPNSTTPPIADTLWDNHNLTHCRMMMEKLA
jgi:hypothetical protein